MLLIDLLLGAILASILLLGVRRGRDHQKFLAKVNALEQRINAYEHNEAQRTGKVLTLLERSHRESQQVASRTNELLHQLYQLQFKSLESAQRATEQLTNLAKQGEYRLNGGEM